MDSPQRVNHDLSQPTIVILWPSQCVGKCVYWGPWGKVDLSLRNAHEKKQFPFLHLDIVTELEA